MRDKDLYQKILGIESPWRVTDVELFLEASPGQVVVHVELEEEHHRAVRTVAVRCQAMTSVKSAGVNLDTCLRYYDQSTLQKISKQTALYKCDLFPSRRTGFISSPSMLNPAQPTRFEEEPKTIWTNCQTIRMEIHKKDLAKSMAKLGDADFSLQIAA